jgi:hypothetical protein
MLDKSVALTPTPAGCLPGMRGIAAMCFRVALSAAAALEAVDPLGYSACTRFRGETKGLQGDGSSVRRMLTCPATWGEDGRSGGRMPGPGGGFPAAGYVAPARGLCAPVTAYGRAPLAVGWRGDAGENHSRIPVPGQRRPVAEGRTGMPRNSGYGLPRPRRRREGRRQECCDHRRAATAACAPGRRTTGTGVLDRRRPDVRSRKETGSNPRSQRRTLRP